MRNGHARQREVMTAAGTVAVRAPRVDDRRVDPVTGERARFRSQILPRRRERLLWSGTLTPAEYTATYELLIDHQIGKPPLVYVARPGLRLVDGQGLPHVYALNTLCLFLGNREWHESIPIADTLVPWTSQWLLFYELWLPPAGNGSERESILHQDH